MRGQLISGSPGHPLSPADSGGQQSRDTRCWLPGGDQSGGLKRVQTGRARTCAALGFAGTSAPRSAPRGGWYRGLFALGKAKAERKRRAFPVPSEKRSLEGLAAGEGCLSLHLSFITVSNSPVPLSLSASRSWLAQGSPSSSLAQAQAQWCTKDTRKPQIRFQLKLPNPKLALRAWDTEPSARPTVSEGLRRERLIPVIGSIWNFHERFFFQGGAVPYLIFFFF